MIKRLRSLIKKRAKSATKFCKECGIEFDPKKADKIHGKDTQRSLLGFCSIECYSKDYINNIK